MTNNFVRKQFRRLWNAFLLSLPLLLPNFALAQFTYTNNGNNTLTITGYTGSDTDVTIPSEISGIPVTGIGVCAFFGNPFSTVVIPDGITNIAAAAFLSCPNLQAITLPKGMPCIDVQVLDNCQNLTNVVIPDSVLGIGYLAFDSCYHLKNVTLPKNLSYIGMFAFDKTALTTVTIPGSVTNVDMGAFNMDYSLTNVVFSSGLTTISYGSFAECGITAVTIPNTLTNIGDSAFAQCTSLQSVYFQGNAPQNYLNWFSPENPTIYYAPGTSGWSSTFQGFTAMQGVPPSSTLQITTTGYGMLDGQFGFTISGNANTTIAVQARSDLSSTWTTLATCSITNGSIYFSDPDSAQNPCRFYRVHSL